VVFVSRVRNRVGPCGFSHCNAALLRPSGNSLPVEHAPYDMGPGLGYVARRVFHFLADSIDGLWLLIHHFCLCARPHLFV